jgi:hypothetical protein
MTHPLQTRVAATSRQANRLLWQYGLCRFLAAAVALVAVIGVLDYLLRWHDPGLRWLVSVIALAGIGLSFYVLARPVFLTRRRLIDIAQRVEWRFPQLGERLSSSMAFLAQGQDDPTAGSPALRRSVVAEAEALSAGLDFNQALDARPSRRAAIVAGIAVAVAALLALLNPAATGLAAMRLAMPWEERPWPRRHELEFVDPPSRLAAGDDFQVELKDRRGTLPDVVRIELEHHGPQGSRTEAHEMKRLGERMVYRVDNVVHPFSFRASGGDDDTMGWLDLQIVEPPKVVELRIEVQPPAYTSLPVREEGRVVKALIGSQLRIQGRLDKPIAKAALRSETPEFSLPAVTIAPDGLSFAAGLAAAAPWNFERSGTLWFDLTDEQGLVFGRDTRIEMQALPDSAPALAWETPPDHSFVTPRAIVPIKALVKDDLAIRGIQLRFLRPGASEQEQVLELYTGPAARAPLVGPMGEGDGRIVDYGWDLARLGGLSPGDALAVRLTAEDYKPQLATTVVRRLTIVTEEELENRVTQRQGSILSQLVEALSNQRQCREQVSTIESRLSDAQALEPGDLNHLQSAQLNQRRVEKLLGGEEGGVESQLVAALAELEVNRVGSQAAATRLNELLTKVRELNRGPLPLIEQELTQAFKSAGEFVEPTKSPAAMAVVGRLQSAGQQQENVIAVLEGMLGALAEWDSYSRLGREIGQIRTDQAALAEETEALRLKMVAAAADAPAPADRDAARKLSQRELELARRLDKIQSRMEEMLARLEAIDPLTAGTLADALDTARRLAIGGRMREAAAQLTEVKLGPAHQTEQAAIDGLKQLLELLSSRRDQELARSLASLREANSMLSDLLTRGQQLQAALAEAAAEPDAQKRQRELQRLTKELEELAAKVEQLGRQLQRLRANQPAASLSQAAGKGRAASQAAADGNAEQAQAQSKDAQRLLEEAQDQLAGAVAEAEQQLAQEQLARIEQSIAGIVARQKNVIAETQRLDALQQAAPLDAAQLAALRSAAAEERMLADEADQLRPRLDAAPAFAFALEGIIERMRQAAAGLQRGEAGQAVQQAEQAALARLEQMLAALKPDESDGGEDTPPPEQQGNPPMAQPPPGDLAGAMAELKLLKLLQEEINRRTSVLEESRANNGQPSPADEEELAALAREQGRLADMVYNLIEATAPRPEDNPDALPEPMPQHKPPPEPELEESE